MQETNQQPEGGADVRSSELVMLRRAELELHCGITNMRSLIDQLNGMQQIWARAADALKAAQHNTKLSEPRCKPPLTT